MPMTNPLALRMHINIREHEYWKLERDETIKWDKKSRRRRSNRMDDSRAHRRYTTYRRLQKCIIWFCLKTLCTMFMYTRGGAFISFTFNLFRMSFSFASIVYLHTNMGNIERNSNAHKHTFCCKFTSTFLHNCWMLHSYCLRSLLFVVDLNGFDWLLLMPAAELSRAFTLFVVSVCALTTKFKRK